jgi:hypothetical protein
MAGLKIAISSYKRRVEYLVQEHDNGGGYEGVDSTDRQAMR